MISTLNQDAQTLEKELNPFSLIDFIRNNIVIDFVLLIKSNYYFMLSAIHDIFII